MLIILINIYYYVRLIIKKYRMKWDKLFTEGGILWIIFNMKYIKGVYYYINDIYII